MTINTNEIRAKLRHIKSGELQPTAEAVQALKDVVEAVPVLLDEVERLRARCEATDVVTLMETNEAPFEFDHYTCPNCKRILSQRLRGAKTPLFTPNYCCHCGQRLAWRGLQGYEKQPELCKDCVCQTCESASDVESGEDLCRCAVCNPYGHQPITKCPRPRHHKPVSCAEAVKGGD